jgi:hypothetical protein
LTFGLLGFALGCAAGTQAPGAGPAKVVAPATKADWPIALPNKSGTLKFAVLGDFGTGLPQEYQLAEQINRAHQRFPFELVILVGDNLYGSERPQDFQLKFETPYKPLLDAGVKFYASMGNHDDRNQRFYKLFNMEGKFYYSLKAPKQSVKFVFLESTYADPPQIKWVGDELKGTTEDWRIAVFHHPLYSSGGRHGSELALREMLEPLFVEYNVSVVFNGHDHFYERIKPQKGIQYFVVGAGGQLAPGDILPGTGLTAKGFDTEQSFLLVEIDGDQMYFNAISRSGNIVDSGIILRRPAHAS